ncbi:hypothetical protein Tsubulata_020877 [Turnera subulata]|uniref:glutathione transferase n=1 Tax=Turnera subulata TaxID=218843 RepID=A0A9Q0FJT7_9ROSI|nr:hypothetical protein Tsubulata_020877 [Turnera subulata]
MPLPTFYAKTKEKKKQTVIEMSKEELVLLDFGLSPFCMRVKIALAEKGLAYEVRAEHDLFGGKSELLIKSNPTFKKVPVLLHNGKALCESTVILSYIDETWPTPPLLPPCAYARAQARFLADYVDKKLFQATYNITMRKDQDAETLKKDLLQVLKVLEEALGEKNFFGGDTFGYADIATIPFALWYFTTDKLENFKCNSECPKLSSWVERCMQRKSVTKAIPDQETLSALLSKTMKIK